MSSLPGNIAYIPHYVEAPSLKELQRRMLRLNTVDGFQYQYFDIQKVDNGWVAFYYKSLDTVGLADHGNEPKPRRP